MFLKRTINFGNRIISQKLYYYYFLEGRKKKGRFIVKIIKENFKFFFIFFSLKMLPKIILIKRRRIFCVCNHSVLKYLNQSPRK